MHDGRGIGDGRIPEHEGEYRNDGVPSKRGEEGSILRRRVDLRKLQPLARGAALPDAQLAVVSSRGEGVPCSRSEYQPYCLSWP